MRKVLIGTPCYDGKLDVWHVNSLIGAVKIALEKGIQLIPIWMSYDALVQRARNDLVSIAVGDKCDDLIFIDGDIEFDPQWVFDLLSREEDVVGIICPKKSDEPHFNIKALPQGLEICNDLIEIESVGTGMLKISRKALNDVWEISRPYTNSGKECRMVFDIQIKDGELVSEDNVFCQKWRSLGNKVYVDPYRTCNHIGHKKYTHKFLM